MTRATDRDIEQAKALRSPHVNAVVAELQSLRKTLREISQLRHHHVHASDAANEAIEIAKRAVD